MRAPSEWTMHTYVKKVSFIQLMSVETYLFQDSDNLNRSRKSSCMQHCMLRVQPICACMQTGTGNEFTSSYDAL